MRERSAGYVVVLIALTFAGVGSVLTVQHQAIESIKDQQCVVHQDGRS